MILGFSVLEPDGNGLASLDDRTRAIQQVRFFHLSRLTRLFYAGFNPK